MNRKSFRIVNIFVASPGDVADERQRLAKVVAELNEDVAANQGLALKLRDWHQVLPDMGRPQQVILDQIPVQAWDIFIGILWLRFGTPTGASDATTGQPFVSGTEEEFRLAYRAWQEIGRPQIMFYHCVRAPGDMRNFNSEQFQRVQQFVQNFAAVGGAHPGLHQEFTASEDFESLIRKHLTRIVLEHGKGDKTTRKEAQRPHEFDWQKLFQAFQRRKLDRIYIKHVGGSVQGPEWLNLDQVYFEQDAGKRVQELNKLGQRSAEALKKWLKNADLWQAQLWRFRQEHRELDFQTEIDAKKSSELIETVLAELKDLDPHEHLAATGRLESIIARLEKKIEKKPEEILTLLYSLLESSVERKPILTHLQAPVSALLIGDAGMGKTTAMRRLALKLFKDLEAGSEGPIPIFVRLDQIASFLQPDQPMDQARIALLRYICHHWKGHLGSEAELSVTALQDCSHPIQFILDGLDEIPSATLRMKLATVVQEMTQKSKFAFIVTSRPAAVDAALVDALKAPEIRLLEFSGDQTRRFVRNFLRIYHGDDPEAGSTDAQVFQSALDGSRAAQEFARNPLYLTVMILMHKKHNVLPKRRLELYAEFYELLLLQRTSGQEFSKMADKPVFELTTPTDKKITWAETVYTPLLQRIAYLTHQDAQDSVSISQARVIAAIQESIGKSEYPDLGLADLARRFLSFADDRLGVLVARGPFYAFSHRSLQEFLAARHLANFDESQQIKNFWTAQALKNPERWLEVARLLICEIRSKPFLFGYLESQWVHDIADARQPNVITLVAAILSDLEEFFKDRGGIESFYQCIVRALGSRRDRSHSQPAIFLACGDGLALLNEPVIDVANPPLISFTPDQPFEMGSNEGYEREKPIHKVQLSPYWLGRYPVTNREYAAFISDGGYENETYWHHKNKRFGFDGLSFLRDLKEKLPAFWLDERFGKSRPLAPVVGVSWYEAMAYCRWWTRKYGQKWAEAHPEINEIKNAKAPAALVLRLPTEAEWEFAARGHAGRKYPWGLEEPTSERANYDDSKLKQTTTVGSYPAGATPEGALDLAGNVWEWCYDWYDEGYYRTCEEETKRTRKAVVDPVGPASGSFRVVRGGSWASDVLSGLRGAVRVIVSPVFRIWSRGFRICLSPE